MIVIEDELRQRMTSRKLKRDDLDAIVEIDVKVLGNRRPSYWEQKIEEMGDEKLSKSLVAEVDNVVQGFIMGTVSGWEFGVPNTIGWIDTIGINPAYQHKGVATFLFASIVKEFKKDGVENIYTLVKWEDWDLMSFFKTIGFTRGDMINLEYKL